MIGKIQPANPNVGAAVEYNERKVRGLDVIREHEFDEELVHVEEGTILATRNVPEDSTLLEEFEKLKVLNFKMNLKKTLKNETFHMSVNPSETDASLSDEKAVELIDELMKALGYEKQPYRIYKHTDIERLHFHVVSTRAGQDGKKVNDSFERMTLRSTLKKLAPKYGFTVVLNEKEKAALREETITVDQVRKEEEMRKQSENASTRDKQSEKKKSEETKSKTTSVPSFSRKSDKGVKDQVLAIFEDAMRWHFSTFEQMQSLLLRRYNVLIEVERNATDDDGHIMVSGTGTDGMPITPIMHETEIGIEMMRRLKEKMEREKMSARKEQRKRLEGLARAAADYAGTWEQFQTVMEKKGVYVVLSWTKEGTPFGVTYIDRATRCCWKGSETTADFKWLKETAGNKGWQLKKDRYQTAVDKRNSMPSRIKTIKAYRRSDDVQPAAYSKESRQHGGAEAIFSAIRAGGHHRDGASHVDGGKRDIWDEALAAAEREEMEKKKAENQAL